MRYGLILLAAFLVWSTQSFASDWHVNQDASAILFEGTHAGSPFELRFSGYDLAIDFDPNDTSTSRVVLVLDASTAKTGSMLYDRTLPQAEWLDSEAYPEIRFVSQAVEPTPDGFLMGGTLSVKGQNYPLEVPFRFSLHGNAAKATGTVLLDRIALNIGTKSDPSAQWVSRDITLRFDLSATRQ